MAQSQFDRAEERRLLTEIAFAIGRSADTLRTEEITGAAAMVGREYNHELMVVGRAVNGWKASCYPSELTVAEKTEWFVTEMFKSGGDAEDTPETCALDWVNVHWGKVDDYNTRRSAFWRSVRRIVVGLGVVHDADRSWPSRIVWSNLYKIAPSKGGNPRESLAAAQSSGCKRLLLREIKTFRPKRIVFATGGWANEFLTDEAIFVSAVEKQRSENIYRFGSVFVDGNAIGQFVVSDHPQGKNESLWSAAVLSALRAAEVFLVE
jgi:hypothetical protein